MSTPELHLTVTQMQEMLAAAGKPGYSEEKLQEFQCAMCVDIPTPDDDAVDQAPRHTCKDHEFALLGCGCNIVICGFHARSLFSHTVNVGIRNKCPVCKQPATRTAAGQVLKDHSKQTLFDRAVLECAFSGDGCGFTGTPAAMLAHLRVCDHLPVKCPMYDYGCKCIMKPTELAAHLNDQPHNQFLVAFCGGMARKQQQFCTQVQSLNTAVVAMTANTSRVQTTVSSGIATLTANTGATTTSVNGLRADFQSFKRSMEEFMEGKVKKVKHAGPYAEDHLVGPSTLKNHRRERAYWNIGRDDHAAWMVEKKRRKAAGESVAVPRSFVLPASHRADAAEADDDEEDD
jgi:hypothetical protein